ncbi:MaoC family dehydratase N-terminal domain-containing protein [Pseudomonas schmalbachii]|uniref:MaoC family dehydratase N-terminal domain-containing protein n=1 Tax=Pseudomonas schmalbachii TaxID=2816993 RepID=A0ABS3TJH6_9PSED|nr:MaoC family dehydratase N-terminal domain-containing protein [Pseudomonas schmalbachii]MBO3273802.1 MaoC family dehydratase N-terminal domain-containing protein [Pseudomonas schmalbachii]
MADKSLIGRHVATTSAEVEKGRLRFFAKAIGETDPVYTDEAAAKAAGYKSLLVPPTFLKCIEGEGRDTRAFLDLIGFEIARILHAEQSFVYHNLAFAGDVLTFETRISEIYEKKGGALQFAVTETRVTNQDGVHIADVRSSLVQR